jgi:hypothetical protein
MTLPIDILQMESNGVRWVEAVPSLEHAHTRVQELIAQTKGDFIIFDQRTANRLLVKFDAAGTDPSQ